MANKKFSRNTQQYDGDPEFQNIWILNIKFSSAL